MSRRVLGAQAVIPVAAGTMLLPGDIVAVNSSGYAVAASKAENLTVAGVVETLIDNSTGAAGVEITVVNRVPYLLKNDGTIKKTDVLQKCYVADKATVTKTAAGSSVAGIILAVKEDGVIVDMSAAAFLV